MTNLRTKARLAVSEFQSASRTKFEAERWVGGNGAEGLRVLREKVGRD
jgi:hypothetical protein